MSGFSAEWLMLREPYDAAARAATLIAELPPPGDGTRRSVVDLAAGTGANLRYLAPRLTGAQDWRLVDHDGRLLDAAAPALRSWASELGATVESRGTQLLVSARAFECRISLEKLDLASDLHALKLSTGDLVTCSALLDLVGDPWLRELADRCRSARAAVAFALTYDGRMVATPADPLDEHALALFNRHQRRDKGFGPALGPAAAEAAIQIFGERGYAIAAESSDWRLGPEAAKLQKAILDGWIEAAVEIDPARRRELAAWHVRRCEHVRCERAALTVGHRDLVGRLAG